MASVTHNQTDAVSFQGTWSRGRHNASFGGDFRWQQFNTLSQTNPRGTFTFNGAATGLITNGAATPGTGFDFADFLSGIPDASAIAFGNADKYLRAKQPDLYAQDDWRVSPAFSLNLGLRWELYLAPHGEIRTAGESRRRVRIRGHRSGSGDRPERAPRPSDRNELSRFADSAVLPRVPAAAGVRVAAVREILAGAARRLRNRLQHPDLPAVREPHGAAVSAFHRLERCQHGRRPADARQRVLRAPEHHHHEFRGGSQPQTRLCPGMESRASARFAVFAANGGGLQRQ